MKRTSIDGRIIRFGPGDLVVNSIVRPSVTVIESASPERPFRSFVLTLEHRALLAPILKREMAARLLLGPLGPWIRSALSDTARSSRIAAARIRSEFEKPLSVAGLAR